MIEVKNLTKRYGTHIAVNNISFRVDEGEIVGFLGPNGAGKTTTMNIITGYISATSGDVAVNGFDIVDEPEKAKQHIGYMPDNPPLYLDMLVTEYLSFVCDIKGVRERNKKRIISEIIETVRLQEVQNRLIKNLSKGYKQRVGLAQALISNPKVIILDEPTVGLDPKQIIEMRDVIKDLKNKHTVILSSHILSEVSMICDRVMIINRGNIVASDSPEKLSANLTSGHQMLVRVKGKKEDIVTALNQEKRFTSVQLETSREAGSFDVTIFGKEGDDIREVLFQTLAKANLPILLMKSLDMTLEDIFLQFTAEGGDKA